MQNLSHFESTLATSCFSRLPRPGLSEVPHSQLTVAARDLKGEAAYMAVAAWNLARGIKPRSAFITVDAERGGVWFYGGDEDQCLRRCEVNRSLT